MDNTRLLAPTSLKAHRTGPGQSAGFVCSSQTGVAKEKSDPQQQPSVGRGSWHITDSKIMEDAAWLLRTKRINAMTEFTVDLKMCFNAPLPDLLPEVF